MAGFDRTHNFEAYGVYELPFGNGKRWATNGIRSKPAGGWQLNWMLSAMSGTPFTITDSGDGATALNAPGNTQTVNVVAPIHLVRGQPQNSCSAGNLSGEYFDPASCAQVTAPGVLGTAGRNILRGLRAGRILGRMQPARVLPASKPVDYCFSSATER